MFQAELSYFLSGPDTSLFLFDQQTATLRTATPLNFESGTTFFNLTISVFDQGGMSDAAELQITVLDSNDQVPTFTPNVLEFTISESTSVGFEITVVVATDGDQGENGAVYYFLSNDEVFTIDVLTGVLAVNSSLDYERQTEYSLLVTGQDGGTPPLGSNLTITIFILDENDNAPEILNMNPVFNISENVPIGERVGAVEASDADSNENAELQFEITAGSNGLFAIHPSTGEITTIGAIDREQQAQYELIIEVIQCTMRVL